MSKVQSITFVFENCESLELPIRYFGIVEINDIQTHIRRTAINAVDKFEEARDVFLEIFSEANKEYDWELNSYRFIRLQKFRDIVYLDIKYDDESTESIYVDYDSTCADNNKNQDMWVSNLGNLYIAISKRKAVADFIYEKDANNETAVGMRKSFELINEVQEHVDFPVPDQ